jgi:hypothetical protein
LITNMFKRSSDIYFSSSFANTIQDDIQKNESPSTSNTITRKKSK